MALDLVRKPWEFDVLVTENIFGDILSDLAGGLVGGMGMAACGEIGDDIGLFQPAHGSAPDIMGQDKANPLAAILSAALMADYIKSRFNDNQNDNNDNQISTFALFGVIGGLLSLMVKIIRLLGKLSLFLVYKQKKKQENTDSDTSHYYISDNFNETEL